VIQSVTSLSDHKSRAIKFHELMLTHRSPVLTIHLTFSLLIPL